MGEESEVGAAACEFGLTFSIGGPSWTEHLTSGTSQPSLMTSRELRARRQVVSDTWRTLAASSVAVNGLAGLASGRGDCCLAQPAHEQHIQAGPAGHQDGRQGTAALAAEREVGQKDVPARRSVKGREQEGRGRDATSSLVLPDH